MNCTDCSRELRPVAGLEHLPFIWTNGETSVCAYCMGKAWVILMAERMSTLS